MTRATFLLCGLVCATAWVTPACTPGQPEVGSQTNWLRPCDSSAACGDLECLCGSCTIPCTENTDCSGLGSSACIVATEAGATAVCDGQTPSHGLCLPRCVDTSCEAGLRCVAGACVPASTPTAHVSIDPSVKHQALIGFGASLAYDEQAIAAHPERDALLDAMFAQSGFAMLRIRNHFEGDNTDALSITRELISEAEARLGRRPTLFLTSGSPPAALKANGDRNCDNADPNCTLVRGTDGGFDYAGFAEFWRASLEAYEGAGLMPDYVSIQNHPQWVPPDSGLEACRFLPEEGTAQVVLSDGSTVDVAFPGYMEALSAVMGATGSTGRFAFAAPEVGREAIVDGFVNPIASSAFDAFAVHFYGVDPEHVDMPYFERLRSVAEATGKPIIQSEMHADGISTAILTHQAVTLAGASAYLHQGFLGQELDEASSALIGTDGQRFATLPAYHALAHYARDTEPGWIRVDAASDAERLLVSAWLSPNESSVTLVLVNADAAPVDVEVTVPAPLERALDVARVTRTTFRGDERSVHLGTLPADRVVRIPGRAIATIATPRQ